jgi:hypothetical protein
VRRAAIRVPGVAIAAISAVLAVCGAAPPPSAPRFAASIDAAAIARAVALGRSSDPAARQRFHDAYVIPLNDSLLDRLEVVTEFRRVVLATEDRARAGDVDWGPRQAADMLQPWRDKITLILHVSFPPNNTYRVMPRFDIVLYGRPQTGAARRIEPLDLLETPRYIADQPAPPGTPILAGVVRATFGTRDLDPRSVYLTGLAFEGRELRRVEVDFGRIE